MERQEKKPPKPEQQDILSHYEEMKEIAYRDALTGLLNRGAMERAIIGKLQDMEETECCALFIVDLDNFKTVNDTLGHQTGDRVLAKAAKTLANMFRATDVIGRLGGDEFIVFLSGNLTEEMVRGKARVICDQIQYVMGVTSEVVVTASVGVHLAVGKQSFESLYRSADLALYRVKEKGKQGYCIKTDWEGQEDSEKGNYTTVNAIRVRSLLNYIDSGVAMVEMKDEMSFAYASPAFARMVGIEKEEMKKISVTELIYPDDRQKLEDLFRNKVMEDNEAASEEVRIVTGDGSVRWWRIHAVRVEYNEANPMIMVSVVDISELKEKESALRENNALFQLAMSQTAQGIWEVELAKKTFRMMGGSGMFSAELQNPKLFPDDLIKEGWVCPESEEGFRSFAEEVFYGKPQGYANFKINYTKDGFCGWASFSYRTVYDELGQAVRVVGVIEGMNHEVSRQQNQPKGLILPECLRDDVLVQFNGNLTENRVLFYWKDGRDITRESSLRACEDILLEEMERALVAEGKVRLSDAFPKDAFVLTHLEKKYQWMTHEYQRLAEGGTKRWVSCTVNLYMDAENHNTYVMLWIHDLEKRRRWEQKYGVPVYKDPIHKLYTRSTVRELSTRVLEAKENKLCALVMMEISGMARLYAQYTENINEKWKVVITALLMAIGTDCIPGQFGTDCYIFFFPEIKSEEVLKRRLEQTILFVRNVISDSLDGKFLRFVAGAVCRYQNETDYNFLMKKAQTVCQRWGHSSGDRVVFAGEDEESGWEQLSKTLEEDRLRTVQEGAGRPLSEKEKDVAFHCVLEMFDANSLEDSSRCVLRTLGEYYDADRTYILVPVDKGNIVTMPHEWTSSQKSSIQQVVSGTMTSKFPLLEQCARENKPVILTRRTPMEKEKQTGQEIFWHFAIFPMRLERQVQGYLCIENAMNYVTDDALPSVLSSCLLKERRKYIRNAGAVMGDKGILTMDLPSRTSYMREIYTYSSDVYDSLGVISVDIPNFAVVNENQGFEYGRRMLWHIIHTMTEDFGRSFLYRTWDAEFVALCPNTSRKLFYGKCAKLRATLTGRYPKEVRVGYAWADKVFTGKALADEARLRMRYDTERRRTKQKEYQVPLLVSYGSVGEMIQDGRVTVYFQPKIDMRTGELIGAEALVRGVDESNTLIYPHQFIGELEKNGLIRDLDLFVLNRTLEMMERWKKTGKELLPVSVNFSRFTLLDSWILSSVLAIHSRHLDIHTSMIEIELTESFGMTSSQPMEETISRLRDYGLSFSLDNVGAKSTNLDFALQVRFTSIKLDRSFVAGIEKNKSKQSLLKDIMEVCRRKKIRCIAEGVETAEQKEMLLYAGCHYAQGYYYDEALPEERFFEKYLK